MKQFAIGDKFMCNGIELEILDAEPIKVENEFSGMTCMLIPEALAVLDYIKGAELLGQPFTDQLHYFQERWTDEYYILLD